MIDLIEGTKIGSFILGLLGGLSSVFAFAYSTRNIAKQARDQSLENKDSIKETNDIVSQITTDVEVIKERTKGIDEIRLDVKKILSGNAN